MYCSNCGEPVPDGSMICPHCGNQISTGFEENESDSLTPYDYEECVAEHLRKAGYKKVYTTKKSGDYGADVVGISPNGKKVCVQCKKYVNPVGVKAVQEIYSAKAYYNCELAYVYTTSSFTSQAQELADRIGVELFIYIPNASLVPKRKYSAPRSNKRRVQRRSGCLVPFLIVIGLIVLLTHAVEKEETKKRTERKDIVVSAVNRDKDPSAKITILPDSGESKQPTSIIVEGICYLLVDDHFEVVCLYDFERTSIHIQESIDGIPVTVIREEAFEDEIITSVVLPDSIREIQRSAFSTCRKLTSINLPDGLTDIAQNTFILCESLSNISLPKTVTKIHSGAFSSTALTSINLENVPLYRRQRFFWMQVFICFAFTWINRDRRSSFFIYRTKSNRDS